MIIGTTLGNVNWQQSTHSRLIWTVNELKTKLKKTLKWRNRTLRFFSGSYWNWTGTKTLNGDSTVLFFDSSHSFAMRQQFLYDWQAQYLLHALIRHMHFLFLTFFVFSQFFLRFLTKNIFVTFYEKQMKSL